MRKTRLNKITRELLINLAKDKVYNNKVKIKLEELDSKIANELEKLREEQYPMKDMKILDKYEKTYSSNRVYYMIRIVKESETLFEYGSNDNLSKRLMPECLHDNKIRIEDTNLVHELIKEYDNLHSKYCVDCKELFHKYEQLIKSSTTFEDVVSVWEEAEELRDRICNPKQLSIVSEELITTIKRDVASRK